MIMESYREMYRKCCGDLVLTSSVTSITLNLSYSRIKGGCSRICLASSYVQWYLISFSDFISILIDCKTYEPEWVRKSWARSSSHRNQNFKLFTSVVVLEGCCDDKVPKVETVIELSKRQIARKLFGSIKVSK